MSPCYVGIWTLKESFQANAMPFPSGLFRACACFDEFEVLRVQNIPGPSTMRNSKVLTLSPTVDSKTLDYGFGVIYGGVPSFFCFGIRGWSYSKLLASTVTPEGPSKRIQSMFTIPFLPLPRYGNPLCSLATKEDFNLLHKGQIRKPRKFQAFSSAQKGMHGPCLGALDP